MGNKAISWYREGRCPSCGKRIGDPRGLEYRKRTLDLFCHSCRKVWPMEIEPNILVDGIDTVSSYGLTLVRREGQAVATPTVKLAQTARTDTIFLKFFRRITGRR